jgi:hypothetical protein
MKIVVCGCSFSSPVGGKFEGMHWSELLSLALGAELIGLARQGISNNVIRLQINEAIKLDPDLVLINSTTPDRIEFPIDPDLSTVDPEKYVSYTNGAYNYQNGLNNFNYPGHSNTMISETMFSIIDWPKHPYRNNPISSDIKFATKLYASYLYDTSWKKQCDRWIINSGLWELINNKIPFLYNNYITENKDLPQWVIDKHTVPSHLDLIRLMKLYKVEGANDPGYHTTAEGQQFIADEYLKILKKRKLI